MSARTRIRTGIVALERAHGACPTVTFQFPMRQVPAQASGSATLVTLTLCEWQRVAQQVAEAAAAIGR